MFNSFIFTVPSVKIKRFNYYMILSEQFILLFRKIKIAINSICSYLYYGAIFEKCQVAKNYFFKKSR